VVIVGCFLETVRRSGWQSGHLVEHIGDSGVACGL